MQRRLAVELLLIVRGVDRHGVRFEDSIQSCNISRTGACFATTRALDPGMNVQFTILQPGVGQTQSSFSALARIVRAIPGKSPEEKIVGVQFLDARFNRVFSSETGE